MRWIKYGTQSDIRFTMVKRGVVDLAVSADWTPAAADSAISKDGGNLADTTNTVAVVSSGTATRSGVDWKLTISATEAQAAELNIQIVDAATKAVEDQFLTVYTYGNASAKFAGDWSDIVRLGLTGLANATPGAAGGLLIAGTNVATTFNGVAASGATPATAGLTISGGAASTTGGGVSAAGIVVTGGAGAASTNGAANGATFAGGGTNTVASTADGIKVTGTSTGHGLDAQSGAGATGNGINAVSNASNGSGITLTKAGSGSDLNASSTPLILAKTTNITGFNDIAATAVVSSGAITTSGGAVSTVTSVTNAVLISAGTGSGQLDFTSGVVKANLAQILGTALTETAGLLAGGFKKFFNVSSPTGTLNSIPDAVAGATGGLFIAGTNAATTVTTALTTTFTGNLTGSVASVTGAVASVTARVTANMDQVDGAALTAHAAGKVPADVLTIAGTAQTARDIGASVIVATNNDKSGYSLTQTFPSNFSTTVISATGIVDVNVKKIDGVTIVGDGSATPFTV